MATGEQQEYTVVLFKKGAKYDMLNEDIKEQNHQAHIAYQAELKANGILVFAGTIADDSDVCGITIFTLADKEQVKTFISNDPGVTAEMFDYDILSSFGLPAEVME